jgi:DNA invertase Pin-like site-specific DNA recombinase
VERHVAIYVRVSSRAQSEASQLPDLKRWAEAQGGTIRWYRDRFTGKTMERPGWGRLQAALESGAVSQVVVWRLDRFGRTAKGLTALFDDLARRRVNLVSLREGVDLSTASGRMLANVIASMAQYETEVRHERVIAGLAAAKERGVRLGRPAVGKGRGTRTKVTAEQEMMVLRLKSEGKKVAAIARAVGLSRPTVYAILKADPATLE